MLFGEIDIPDELIEAQQKNELVVFAGAGVSKRPPTNLPLFGELADKVEAHYVMSRDRSLIVGANSPGREDETIDAFLGRVERKNPDLRRLIHSEYSRPCDPNSLHKAIIQLFCLDQDLRIITTNYDCMLQRVASEERDRRQTVYVSPALPLDARIPFAGIACIHGSVDRDKESLIYTDTDIARAYVTPPQWATAFAGQVLQQFTVLFVGYSLNDVIFRYLLRGIEPRHCFAFCLEEDAPKWRNHNIIPVPYKKARFPDDHFALNEALLVWSAHTQTRCGRDPQRKTDFIAQEKWIAALVSAPPANNATEKESILEIFRSFPSTRLFVRHAGDAEWLAQLDKYEVISPLFDRQTKLSAEIEQLAKWIADRFVITDSSAVLYLIHRHSGHVNPVFWYWIVDELTYHRRHPRPAPESLLAWVTYLIAEAPPDAYRHMSLDYLLAACEWPADRHTAMTLLSHLLEPIPVSKRGISFTSMADVHEKYEFEIRLRGDDYWLRENTRGFKTRIPDLWGELLPTVQKHLTDAQNMSLALGQGARAQSYWRSAVEPHEQDEDSGRGFDVLIDIARDILEHLLCTASLTPLGKSTVEMWYASDVTLMQRIAIHGLAIAHVWPPDQKIEWLLDRDLVYEHWCKHEVFQAIEASVPQCSEQAREKLARRALDQESVRTDSGEVVSITPYMRYNLVQWMAQHAPDSEVITSALASIVAKHPNFKPREYPDFDVWTSGVVGIEPESPVTPAQLLALPLPDSVTLLMEHKGRHEFRGDDDRRGLLEVLTAVAANNFNWSMDLAVILIKGGKWKGDVWYYIIDGWRRSPLSEAEWDAVLTLLSENPGIHAETQNACKLLEEAVKKKEDIPDERLAKMEDLSDIIWEQMETLPEGTPYEAGWLTKAINHGSGQLCEFWLNALYRRKRGTGAQWAIIPDDYMRRFQRVMGGTSYSAKLARCVLGSRCHFLYNMDEKWTTEHLLPAFDFANDKQSANQVWHGFLTWGQIQPKLAQNMKPSYLKAIDGLEDTGNDQLREQLFRHITDILLMGMRPDPDMDWFYAAITQVGTTIEDRVEVVTRIWQTIREAEPGFKESIWNKLLKPFWADRLAGKPLPLSKDESNRLIECVPRLAEVFIEAVDMACQTTGFAFPYTHLYTDLEHSKLPESHPRDVARLIVHLLKDDTSSNQEHSLVPVYRRLKAVLTADEIHDLTNVLVKVDVVSALDEEDESGTSAPGGGAC